jgi:predicted DNA-binding transcriptional regulator AlpA
VSRLSIHAAADLPPSTPPTPSAVPSLIPPALLSAKQAAAMCSLSPATWHRMNAAGRCPAPLRLSAGCVRWRSDELRDWVEAGCPARKTWEALRARAQANGRPATGRG